MGSDGDRIALDVQSAGRVADGPCGSTPSVQRRQTRRFAGAGLLRAREERRDMC